MCQITGSSPFYIGRQGSVNHPGKPGKPGRVNLLGKVGKVGKLRLVFMQSAGF